jgi:hypothetical protein
MITHFADWSTVLCNDFKNISISMPFHCHSESTWLEAVLIRFWQLGRGWVEYRVYAFRDVTV